MANEYTPNFRYRMPAIGDEFWADEFYQNQEIKDAVTKNHLVGAKVSGLLVTVNSGLSISWEAGTVTFGNLILTVLAGSAILQPSNNVNILVPTYIYTDGTNVFHSVTVPTLQEGTLLAMADVDTQNIVALVDTRIVTNQESLNNIFYVATSGDDSAEGSSGAPWATLEGALNNLAGISFSPLISELTLHIAAGNYSHDYSDGLEFPILSKDLYIIGAGVSSTIFEVTYPVLPTVHTPAFILADHSKLVSISLLYIRALTTDSAVSEISGIGISNCANILINSVDMESFTYFVHSTNSTVVGESLFLDVASSYALFSDSDNSFSVNNSSLSALDYLINAINGSIVNLNDINVHLENLNLSDTINIENSQAIFTRVLFKEIYNIDDGNVQVSGTGRLDLIACMLNGIGNIQGLSVTAVLGAYVHIYADTSAYGTLDPPANTTGNDNSYIKVD